MIKKEFKDYPNTDTPIDAENLNEVQDNVENALDEKFDKSGGTITGDVNITGQLQVNGGKVLNILEVYPIGSIYMSVNSTNPSSLFGGTWERFGQGRVVVGVDENQTEFNETGKTGGSKTNMLNQNNLPRNLGTIRIYDINAPGQSNGIDAINMVWSNKYRDSVDNLYNPLSQAAVNNLQPYITCYMWKRVA
jgi:hypothetical protein